MIVYHGSNHEIPELAAGSWITADIDVAWHFAAEKSVAQGGEPTVMSLEVDDLDVDWDMISMAAGVDDERGTLTISLSASTVPQVEALRL